MCECADPVYGSGVLVTDDKISDHQKNGKDIEIGECRPPKKKSPKEERMCE